jgi:hypothetical protein
LAFQLPATVLPYIVMHIAVTFTKKRSK